jgi:hypothetical protein
MIGQALAGEREMPTKTRRKRKSIAQTWTGNRQPMKHSDFRIGGEFLSGSGRWRCTDVGKRTIAAIRLNHDDDPAWYNGPPYAIVEYVFDEYDIEACERAPKRRTHDATGRSEITTVPAHGAKPRSKKSDGHERLKASN